MSPGSRRSAGDGNDAVARSGARPRARVEVIEADERARRLLARRYPDLAGRSVVILSVSTGARATLLPAIRRVAEVVDRGARFRLERLIESLLPTVDVPEPPLLERARREAQVRWRVVRDFGVLTAAELADMAELHGSAPGNRAQTAHRWRKDGRIFAVPWRGTNVHLAFQFDDEGQPWPVVAEVLDALAAWPPWDIARWFVTRQPHLERQRPVDLLATDPDAVADAAHAAAAGRGSGPDGALAELSP